MKLIIFHAFHFRFKLEQFVSKSLHPTHTHIYNSYCHQLPRDSLSCRTEYVGPQLTKHLLWIVFVYSLYCILVVCMPHWLVGWLTGSSVAEALN